MKFLTGGRKKYFDFLLSILISILGFVVLHFIFGSYYAQNDDRYMAEILSGSITGGPEAHAIFIHYFLGLMLSALYKITSAVPWYGIFMMLCTVAPFSVVFYAIFRGCKKITGYIYALAGCLLIIACNIYFFTNFQFTSVAGMLAVAGYFILYTGKGKRSRIIGFIVFEILSYFVRYESMLMVQPVGMAVYVALFGAESKDLFTKKQLLNFAKKLLGLICCVGIIVLALYATDSFAYSSKEWKEYREYTVSRSYIEDYGTGYTHEQIADILDKYGVSAEQFDLCFKQHWVLKNNIDKDCVVAVAGRLKDINKAKTVGIRKIVYQAVTFGRYDDVKGFFTINLLLYAMIALLIVITRRFKFIFVPLFLFASKCVMLLYLVYRSRYPFRVTGILYFAEFALLIMVMIKLSEYMGGSGWKRLVLALATAACGILCIKTVAGNCRSIKENSVLQAGESEALQQLVDYLDAQPGGYIVDIMAMKDCFGGVLDAKWYLHKDIISSGGWFFRTPFMDSYADEYCGKYNGRLKVVTSGTDEEWKNLRTMMERGIGAEISTQLETVNFGNKAYKIYSIEL